MTNVQRSGYIGRLAPSPTGAQHLGNARTFLVAWLHCRLHQGKLLLRIEDLDTPRTKPGADAQAIEDLRWLGLDWDSEEIVADENPMVLQSTRQSRFDAILEQLKERDLVYPCTCSRSDVERAASAPHESVLDGVVYPGTCSHKMKTDRTLSDPPQNVAWRFRMPEGELLFHDELFGEQRLNAKRKLGDFVVARSYGGSAYQLAVVVDDHDFGVNWVVRGADLIYSTYRQLAIYEALGWTPPNWLHVPLVVGNDGRRLAKRHGDTRLSYCRQRGISSERIIGYLAKSLGFETPNCTTPQQLLEIAQLKPEWIRSIPKEPFVVDKECVELCDTPYLWEGPPNAGEGKH